jgi:hypothetical protein
VLEAYANGSLSDIQEKISLDVVQLKPAANARETVYTPQVVQTDRHYFLSPLDIGGRGI